MTNKSHQTEECSEKREQPILEIPNACPKQIPWSNEESGTSRFSSILKALTNTTQIDYSIDICSIPTSGLSIYVDEEKFSKLCESGCTNYAKKWSCPPFSPHLVDFIALWEKLFVFYLRVNIEQFSYIRNDYLKVRAANSVLKSRVDLFLRKMAEKYGSYISTGSCRLCKPCKCKVGMPCMHPDKMAYSFEAMGVDVDQLVNKLFQKPLLWYKPRCLPKYTSVVCGLLTNEVLTANNLYDEYIKQIIK